MSAVKNSPWDLRSERMFAFLWYLDISDTETLSEITGRTQEQCNTKRTQYPSLEKFPPEKLLGCIKQEGRIQAGDSCRIYEQLARKVYNETSSFDKVAERLTREGIETPEKIHELWCQTYHINATRDHAKTIRDVLNNLLKESSAKKSIRGIEVLLYKNHGIDVVPSLIRRLKYKSKIAETSASAQRLLKV